jgi:hypothetical protein
MSTLKNLLAQAVTRFRPHQPHTPANVFVFGFIAPDEPPLTITISPQHAELSTDLVHAEYLVYGTVDLFTRVFDPTAANRAAAVNQLTLRPNYPFKNYLLSILLNGLELTIPDLNYTAQQMEGYFPFPPRYPITANTFRTQAPTPAPLPAYAAEALPALILPDQPHWVAMYDKAWQLAFKNLRQPEPASGFIANFIDPAFNANTFLWDSCFMLLFGVYGRRVFDFSGTLDNFYAKQHDDGFICREINTYSGRDVFQPLDPRSTGPNIFAWTEWLIYQHTQDVARLRRIFPVLIAYHRWWRDWRTHPDGSYWTSGWGSGMDNQTRVPHSEYHHRHYSWLDATLQQALNCEVLLHIAVAIASTEFIAELQREFAHLQHYVNTQLWDETSGFYYDRAADGVLSQGRSIGAYWGLLTDAVPAERATRLIAHLQDPQAFNRPHRVPTWAYQQPDYHPYGGYWLGAVWSPTNYMVLRGLTQRGEHALAHEIALNHVANVAQVFADTGTLWENYAPEYPQAGKPAGRDFVGWTGLSAITIPLEYLIGVRETSVGILWDLRLLEEHGVRNYPHGATNRLDLHCAKRTHPAAPPQLTITTREPCTVIVQWAGGQQVLKLDGK